MGDFYTDTIQKSPVFNSVERISDPNLLEPTFLELVNLIIEEADELGYKLGIFETYRSEARQKQLFEEKETQLSTVGTHHYGLACDLVKLDANGEWTWEGDYSFVGNIANKHGLVWGGPGKGNLDIDDLDHVQYVAFTDQNKLFAGDWYPDDTYIGWDVG